MNIRKSSNNWLGKIQHSTDKSFEQFDTAEHGIRAAFIIIRTYIQKYDLNRLSTIIARFAPAVENNVDAYVHDVSITADIWVHEPLKFERRSQMARLLWAMHIQENGRAYFPLDYFDKVYCKYFL